LVTHASDPASLEIILGIDQDDDGITAYLQSDIADFLREHSVACNAQIFQPQGYAKMHRYVNQLAGQATGDWLMFWNDDMLMQTDHWDSEIVKHTGEFRLLAPRDNHGGHPYAIVPIIPQDWYRLLDHFSLNAQCDAWVSHIAYMLDIFERIDVEVLHDRADLTGNNNDETYQRRVYKEGNPSDPEDFGHVNQQNARVRAAYKVAWFFKKMGQETTWWDQVVAGEQDPFEKMKFTK
jgi:hypothetical protein